MRDSPTSSSGHVSACECMLVHVDACECMLVHVGVLHVLPALLSQVTALSWTRMYALPITCQVNTVSSVSTVAFVNTASC